MVNSKLMSIKEQREVVSMYAEERGDGSSRGEKEQNMREEGAGTQYVPISREFSFSHQTIFNTRITILD